MKYVGNIVKYTFTFVVTVMTLAAAIIPIFVLNKPTTTTDEEKIRISICWMLSAN